MASTSAAPPILIAAMNFYGISRILTFNEDDFRRYPDIEIITPGNA
jgi:predicted nucleic acid-binding protein